LEVVESLRRLTVELDHVWDNLDEEGIGALPGERLFKSYSHSADSSNGRSCFYGPVQSSHAEHEHIPRM
jgi:hypothetical protein